MFSFEKKSCEISNCRVLHYTVTHRIETFRLSKTWVFYNAFLLVTHMKRFDWIKLIHMRIIQLDNFSEYNGPMSNDTFELTSIHGIPIFASEVWRDTSNGEKSITDWVYEKNRPVSPICYFKEHPNIAWLTFHGSTSKSPDDADLKRSLFDGTWTNVCGWLRCHHILVRLYLKSKCILEFRKEINRIAFAQNCVIPIVVFIQIILLLRFLQLDRTMGSLLRTIKRFLDELAKLFLLIIILIIPYGLMQENVLYPNQYLTR